MNICNWNYQISQALKSKKLFRTQINNRNPHQIKLLQLLQTPKQKQKPEKDTPMTQPNRQHSIKKTTKYYYN